ncbi:TPA: glycosyltransferase [Bacillus cereus]|uniref:glycosyltransferase family 2 protein n=1 Tax=Bacillus sp. FSL M8-0139 TaxID=2921613 RepID=UPI0030F677B4|nr:glycosyltransferase [Bacillus cereus]
MLVSIGLPVYNCEKTVLGTINSIISQTYENWELIIVDDGSSDTSLDVINSIKDARIKVYSDGENKGLPYRLNQIAKLAKGEYIARMDSDDLMHPERIAVQIKYLQGNPNIDLIGSGAYIINEQEKVLGQRRKKDFKINPAEVLAKGLFIHPTVFGKTEWFRRNLYSEAYIRAEDHEMWVRTVKNSNFHILEAPLLFYRESAQVNLKNYKLSCKTDRKIFKEYGPDLVGRRKTNKLIISSYCKELIYTICCYMNKGHLLTKNRNVSLSPKEQERANGILEKIFA